MTAQGTTDAPMVYFILRPNSTKLAVTHTSRTNSNTSSATTIGGKSSMHKIQSQQVNFLREETARLEQRVMELQGSVDQMRKDNSMLKMQATLTLGSMKLQIDSLEEDRQFLVEKVVELDRKLRESREDLATKERELEALIARSDGEKPISG